MNTKLFVGNLSFNTTENDLQDAFAAHGTVVEANLMMDRTSGRPRGFGFITMGTPEEAQKAVEALNGSTLDGRALTSTRHARKKSVRAEALTAEATAARAPTVGAKPLARYSIQLEATSGVRPSGLTPFAFLPLSWAGVADMSGLPPVAIGHFDGAKLL